MLGKPLTKAAVDAMSEDQLRREVLIPLFRQMGFLGLAHYHGGILEQGKDIIMWKPDPFRERINYGVVAKAGKISGKASGKGSANEVFFQIEQCLGSPYNDPYTLKPQSIDHCYVVASGDIPKEALESLENVLRPRGYEKNVTFISGDALWNLVEEHLLQRLIPGKLAELHSALRSADEHYDIIVLAGDPRGGAISFREKYPGAAKNAPLTFRGTFQFPPTPGGKKALRKWEKHIATGTPVTIPQEFITEFEVPEIVKKVMGTDAVSELRFGPAIPNVRMPATAEVLSSTGESVAIPGLEIRALRSGTDQATFSNEHQRKPWRFSLKVHWKTRRMSLTCSFRLHGANVKQALEALHFQRALAQGDRVLVRHGDTGLTMFGGPIPQGRFSAPDEVILSVVEALVTIQEDTSTPIVFAIKSLSADEERVILETAEKVRTGRLRGSGGRMGITVKRERTRFLLEEDLMGQHFLVDSGSERARLPGHTIDLGPVLIVIEGMYLEDEDRRKLEKLMAAEPGRSEYSTFLTAPADRWYTMYYPNWLPPEELEQIRPMLDREVLPPAAVKP